jgi:hypothetical protein
MLQLRPSASLPPELHVPFFSFWLLALVAIAIPFGMWIRWNADYHFFAAYRAAPFRCPEPQGVESFPVEDRRVLIQLAEEGIANHRVHDTVAHYLDSGVLKFDNDLQFCSDAMREELKTYARRNRPLVESWETVESGMNWQYAKSILVLLVPLGIAFLLGTQPDLPSRVLGILTGVVAFLNKFVGFRDTLGGLFGKNSPPPPSSE